MSLHKHCADHLRSTYRDLTGNKLGAAHAHELVAAFFGYGTAAALRAESKYPLTAIDEARHLIPDLRRMDQRVRELRNLPVDLPGVDDLASRICDLLVDGGHFSGEVWQDRDLSDHVNAYVQNDPMMVEDDLAGAIATTNAFFDELYIDEYNFKEGDEAFVATLVGSLNGENDPDRVFHGDKVLFTTVMTFGRVAGRVAFTEPELDTVGRVDDSMYYED